MACWSFYMRGYSSWLGTELSSCNQMEMSIVQRQQVTNYTESYVNSGFILYC